MSSECSPNGSYQRDPKLPHENARGISPAALQKLAHLDGELATARAAKKAQVIYIQSTMSTYPIEEVG